MKNKLDDIITRTENLQKEMHAYIEVIYEQAKKTDKKPPKYKDLITMFLLLKIAELQIKLER